jgi:hypothetical protein
LGSNETFDTDIVDISEFFSSGSSGFRDDEPDKKSTFNEIDSPIKELKAIILSLDWEITDEIADGFIAEVDRLSDVWKSDKSVLAFLHILRALGKYLRTHKADAHPDSIKLLYSVYNNFEKIVLTNEISEDQEKQILNEELKKFHKLKEKIALAAAAMSEGKANESLLSALKTILLEIDWQITDQSMQKFDIEINKLERIWSTDKNFLTLLQMMRAIGSYINKNKLDSHPDSIKLLSTVFQHFEKMALSEDLSLEEQQELVAADLEKFTQLKKQIISLKSAPSAEKIVEEEYVVEAPVQQPPLDLPAQVYEEGETLGEEDFGFVEPIRFDTDEATIPPAGISEVQGLPEGGGEEVDNRLNDLFAEDDYGIPADSPGTTPISDMDEVVPLSGEPTEALPSFDEEITPLSQVEEIVPLPEQQETVSTPGQISSDQDIEPVTPLPTEEIEQRGELTVRLIDILDSAENINQLDVQALTDEIQTLRTSLQSPAQQALQRIILSLATYVEIVGTLAAPDCFSLLSDACRKLAETENLDLSQSNVLYDSIFSLMNQYIEFQTTAIFPVISDFAAKEKEIKKILGITL